MTKTFCVAGHAFSLTLPDNPDLWQHLGNYSPFEVEGGEILFDVRLVDSLEERESELVYSQVDEDEPDMTRIDLFKNEDGWLFCLYPNGKSPLAARFQCDGSFRHGFICIEQGSVRKTLFAVNNTLMLMYALSTSGLRTIEMHASVTVKDGKGYLFLGKSGTGKSTHSRQWLENIEGTFLLNDDNPVVRTFPDGSVKVYGTPWSGKTPCYKNESAEVGAVVLIRQCPDNIIRRLSLPEAYAAVFSSTSGFKADEQMSDGYYETISSFVVNVPCFLLDCRPDADAARVCYSAAVK